MNAKVADAISKSAAVPSIPQVVTRFLEVIQDPNFDYDDVVKAIGADAGTVSEILRLANSALFGVSRKVTSLRQALTLLGPRRTRSLVLGRYLVEAVGGTGGEFVDRNYFWRRSLAAAVIGARLADDLCPRLRDEVFLSALLADVGVSILAEAMPHEYGPIAQAYAPHGGVISPEAEQKAVGATHAEVSAMVLAEWSLPDPLCEAVRLSHDANVEAVSEGTHMARIINAADRVGRMLCEIPDVAKSAEECAAAMEFVGAELHVLARILGEVEKAVEELAAILKIDVIPSQVYTKIAEAVRDRLAAGAAH